MNRDTASSLLLSIQGDHASDVAERISVRIDAHDLTIGRAEHCDWVLQAQGVSRQHAVVRHLNGLYFLEDRSTNGMLLNGSPIRGGEPVPLGDGDRLQLDTFDILVAVEKVADETAAPTTARRADERSLETARSSAIIPALAVALPTATPMDSTDHVTESLDPLAWFQTVIPEGHDMGATNHVSSALWSHGSPMQHHFDAPRVDVPAASSPASAVLPENWDLTRSLFRTPDPAAPAPEPAQLSVAPMPMPPTNQPTVAATAAAKVTPPTVLAAAAVAASDTKPAMEELFTQVLEGVMDVLRARAELKNGFRMPATLIRRSENNPLKFAPTAPEALERLLAAPNDAFLSGQAAIADAMDDIRLHQVALLTGVRAAFDDLIAQFDPVRFDDGSDKRGRFGFATGGKAPWARYRTQYASLAADPEERFRRLFGDEFARAYEDQLARAKRDSC